MLSQADGAGRRAVRSLRACLQSGGAPILEIMHAGNAWVLLPRARQDLFAWSKQGLASL